MKRFIMTICLIAVMTAPTFAMSESEINSKISAATSRVKTEVGKQCENIVLGNFPVGSVYKSFDGTMTEEKMHDTFGGSWREITSRFLWATNGADDYKVDENEDGKDDKTGNVINPMNHIGGAGGFRTYDLVAGISFDEDGNVSFLTDGSLSLNNPLIFQGSPATMGELKHSVGIVEGNSKDAETEIMPPYLTVRMFERIE